MIAVKISWLRCLEVVSSKMPGHRVVFLEIRAKFPVNIEIVAILVVTQHPLMQFNCCISSLRPLSCRYFYGGEMQWCATVPLVIEESSSVVNTPFVTPNLSSVLPTLQTAHVLTIPPKADYPQHWAEILLLAAKHILQIPCLQFSVLIRRYERQRLFRPLLVYVLSCPPKSSSIQISVQNIDWGDEVCGT